MERSEGGGAGSLPSLLYRRSVGCLSGHSTQQPWRQLYLRQSRFRVQFLASRPELVPPGASTKASRGRAVTCLDMDNSCEGRFLLSGQSDGTMQAYDLSHWGSDYHLYGGGVAGDATEDGGDVGVGSNQREDSTRTQLRHRHRPIAQSQRSGRQNGQRSGLPRDGHSHTVSACQWYPVDTGIFLSSSLTGELFVWDTNTFQPVASIQIAGATLAAPRSSSLSSATMGGLPIRDIDMGGRYHDKPHMLVAVACNGRAASSSSNAAWQPTNDRILRLCDIKSGSATHSLLGHDAGVTAVRWCPTSPFTLLSGSEDCTLRIWDIRRSGSTACLGIFDRTQTTTMQAQQETILPCLESDSTDSLPRDDAPSNYSPTTKSSDSKKESLARQRLKARLLSHRGSPAPCHGSKRRRGGSRSTDHEGLNNNNSRPSNQNPADFRAVENRTGVESHSGAVTSVQWTADGQSVLSTGLDRRIRLWDMRRRSGTTSAASPGLLVPTVFLGPRQSQQHEAPPSSYPLDGRRRVAIAISQPGYRKSSSEKATVWVGGPQASLLGYDLHGMGGEPQISLQGHLDSIAALTTWDAECKIITGGMDGMLLCWGASNGAEQGAEEHEEDTLRPFSQSFASWWRRPRRHVPAEDRDCWNLQP